MSILKRVGSKQIFITFTDGVSLPQYIESNVVAHKVVESLFVTDGQRQ